jgi:hypothetical protein
LENDKLRAGMKRFISISVLAVLAGWLLLPTVAARLLSPVPCSAAGATPGFPNIIPIVKGWTLRGTLRMAPAN